MNTATLSAAFAAGFIAHAAHADIVHFVNPAPGQPGHFAWRLERAPGWESWLDITSPSTAQNNLISPNSVGQMYIDDPDEGSPENRSWGGAAISRSSFAWGFFATSAYTSGTLIGFSSFWFSAYSTHVLEMEPSSMVTTFPEGARRYMGVRTGDGNYGWIEVERHGMNFTAFAWAYETEPGVPIVAGQVPAPGGAVLLAVGLVAASPRRRPRP